MKNKKIAVIMNDRQEVDSFVTSHKIRVYERHDAHWEWSKELYVNIDGETGLAAIRSEIQKTIHQLDNCRIIAGSEISGILYNEFDRFGFSIFQISESSPEIFDGIIADIKAAEEAAVQDEALMTTQPAETSVAGVYYLDLIKLQNTYPDMSSKKALKEFLDTTPFYELQLLCTHIPPWLSTEVYDIADNKTGDGKILAVIRKKQCGGAGK